MKTLLTTLIFLCFLTPTLSQTQTNINELNPAELRQFLLKLEDDDPAKIWVQKHNTSRISAYSFLALSLVFVVASDKATDPDTDNANSILLSTGAWTSFAIAGVCGIVAGERLKKAKSTYLNNLNVNGTKNESTSFLRDESGIVDSIFKYPRTR